MTNDINIDNLSSEVLRELLKNKMKEERLGSILTEHPLPTKPSKDGYYRYWVQDANSKQGRRQIVAKDIDVLVEKIWDYYNNDIKFINHQKTFEDCWNLAMNDKKDVKDKESRRAVTKTVERNMQSYNRYIKGTFIETMYIDEINKKHLEQIISYNGHRYDLKMHAFYQLKECICLPFNIAFDEEWIGDNPCLRINWKKCIRKYVVDDDDINQRAYSDEERKKILDAIHVQQIKYPLKMTAWACELQILMGTRVGEVPPLKVSDVQGNYVRIMKMQVLNEKNEYVEVQHTKTHVNRIYEIDEELKEYFERLFVVLEKYYPKSEYLFPCDLESKKPVTKKQIKDFFDYQIKKLSLKKDGLTLGLHSFRRNAITNMIEKGGKDIFAVADMFGNSPQTIESNYRLSKYRISS